MFPSATGVALGSQQHPSGFITVDVVSAIIKSPSDSYVEVDISDFHEQTEIIKNSKDPIWRAQFVFRSEFIKLDDYLTLKVKVARPFIGDKIIGALKIHSSDIVREPGRKVLKEKYRLRNEAYELDTDISTVLTFSYLWTSETKVPMTDENSNEITMARADFDGVLRMKLLSAINLCKIDKFKFAYLEITHEKTKKQTEKKTTKAAQFNQPFYFDMNRERKQILFDLYNYTDSKFLAAQQKIDMDQYFLSRQKPTLYNVEVPGVNSTLLATLSCEFTFFLNTFTQSPSGELSIEALTLPKIPDKEKVYFKYIFESGNEPHEEPKFNNIGKIYKFNTKTRLDRVTMICFDYNMGTMRELAKGVLQICEYPWRKNQKNDIDVSTRTNLNLISKDNKIYNVNLNLKYKPTLARIDSLLSRNFLAAETPTPKNVQNKAPEVPSIEALDDNMEKIEEIRETENDLELAKNQVKPRSTVRAKTLKELYTPKNYVLEIESFELKTFLLKLTIIPNPIYYFSMKTSHDDEVILSSFVEGNLLEWHDENLLIFLPQNCLAVVLTLHEKTFCSWNNESKKLVPIDILSFTIEIPKIVKQGLHKLSEITSEVAISEEFRMFVKKNKILNDDSYVSDPLKALEKTKIRIQYEINGTFFIDNPCGILNITSVKGEGVHKIMVDKSKKNIKISVQVSLGKQNSCFDGEVDEQNPIWTKNVSLITMKPQDVVYVRVFETDIDKSTPVLDTYFDLHLLQIFENGERHVHTFDLSKCSTFMRGMLSIDFSYEAVENVSLRNLNEIDIKESKQKSAFNYFYEKTFSIEKPKIPELCDWISIYSNKICKLEIILDEIELDLKQLNGAYIVQPIFKLGDQTVIAKQFYNLSNIKFEEKFEFMANPSKEGDRTLNLLIKVVDFYNPNKIFRVYSFFFDFLKHVQSDRVFIELNKKLIPSNALAHDAEDISNFTFRYKYFEPYVKNLSKKIGLISIRPNQIRLAGVNLHQKTIWHPMTGYFLELAFNGVKSVVKLKLGKPKQEQLIQIMNDENLIYGERLWDASEFFIDLKDLEQDSVLDGFADRFVMNFPLKNHNEDFIKVKLYQIDTEGLSLGILNPRANPFSKLIARGKIDLDHIRDQAKVVYAAQLHKEANLILQEHLSDPIHANLMNIFLTFTCDIKMIEFSEQVKLKGISKPKGIQDEPGLLSTIKEMKFRFLNQENQFLFAKAVQITEKSGMQQGEKDLNCPLRNLVTHQITALKAAGISYNPLVSLFDHRIYLKEKIKNTTQLNIISLEFNSDNDPNDVKKLDPAVFLQMKTNLHDVKFPLDIANKENQKVKFHTEIKNDGFYSGESIISLETISNFFIEIPNGNFIIQKIEMMAKDGAVLENDMNFEFYVKSKGQAQSTNSVKISLKDFESEKDKYFIKKVISYPTENKTDSFVIQIKSDKNPLFSARAKTFLHQFDFPNPHLIAKYKEEDIKLQKFVVLPFPNKVSPQAYLIFNIHCLYKDSTTLGHYAINNFYTIMKFRRALNKKLDTLRKIVYLNPSSPPLIFSGKFRRNFYGHTPYKSDELPIFKLNENNYKEMFTDTNHTYSKKALCLTFPEKTKIILGGVPEIKKPIIIQALYEKMEKKQNQEIDPDDHIPPSFEKKLSPEEYNFRFYSEGERTYCEVQVLVPFSFYFPANDVKDQTIQVAIIYEDRIAGAFQQRANLKYGNYFNDKVDAPPTKLFLFFKPSSTKCLVELSQISSEFIQQPRGRLILEIQRIISLDDDEIQSDVINYKNKTLSLKKESKSSSKAHNKIFRYKIKVSDDDQEFATNIIDAKGIPSDGLTYTMEFLTNGIEQSLNINLILNKEDAHVNNPVMNEIIQDNKKGGKVIIQEDDNPFKSKDIFIVNGKLPLASFSLYHDKKYPVFIPLLKSHHPQNDLYKVLLNSINRENYYLLGKLTYLPEKWYKVEMYIKDIQNIKFIPIVDDPEATRSVGLRVEISKKIDGSTTKNVYTYESSIYNIPNNIQILDLSKEKFNFIYEKVDSENEELFATITLDQIQADSRIKIAGKTILLRKFILSAAKTDDPTTLISKLVKPEANDFILDPSVKDLPIEITVKIKRDLLEITPAPAVKKEKKELFEFDYSKQSIEELLANLLNLKDTTRVINCVKEIDEYFMFLHQKSEEFGCSKAIYYSLSTLICLYHSDTQNLTLLIKAMFSFMNFKPEIVHDDYFKSFLDLMWEIISIYSKHYDFKVADLFYKKDLTIIETTLDLSIHNDLSLSKNDIKTASKEEVEQSLIRNLLKRKRESIVESSDPKEFTKIFTYILKALDLIVSENFEYSPEICSKILPIIINIAEKFLNDPQILNSYIRLIIRVYIEHKDMTNTFLTQLIVQNIIYSLSKYELQKNTEIPENFYVILEFMLKKYIEICKDQADIKVAFDKVLRFYHQNFSDESLVGNYYFFSLFDLMSASAFLVGDFMQEMIKISEIYFKLNSFILLLSKTEDKSIDKESILLANLLYEVFPSYEIKNLNKDRISANIQLLIVRRGLSERAKLIFNQVINIFKEGKEGQTRMKNITPKAVKQNKPSSKTKDITTKYLISKLDWK